MIMILISSEKIKESCLWCLKCAGLKSHALDKVKIICPPCGRMNITITTHHMSKKSLDCSHWFYIDLEHRKSPWWVFIKDHFNGQLWQLRNKFFSETNSCFVVIPFNLFHLQQCFLRFLLSRRLRCSWHRLHWWAPALSPVCQCPAPPTQG